MKQAITDTETATAAQPAVNDARPRSRRIPNVTNPAAIAAMMSMNMMIDDVSIVADHHMRDRCGE